MATQKQRQTARKRGASKGTGSGAGAMTVSELRREAAKLGIEGRSKMSKGAADPRRGPEAPLALIPKASVTSRVDAVAAPPRIGCGMVG